MKILLSASLVAGVASCGSCGDADAPVSYVPAPPLGAGTPRFSFLTGTDEDSRALRVAYDAFTAAPPTTDAEAARRGAARAAARTRLAAHAEAAAAAIIAGIEALPSFDEQGGLAGYFLLGEVESETGVDYLHQQAMKAPPAEVSSGAEDTEHLPGAIASRLRVAAVMELGRRAVAGSPRAKAHLLDLVGGPDPSVRVAAIRAYYDAAGLHRSRAKHELSARLPLRDRYLLSSIY